MVGVFPPPPPTVGSFFIFRLENVQSGAYLRRQFRLDDICMELKIRHGLSLLGAQAPPSTPPPLTSTPVAETLKVKEKGGLRIYISPQPIQRSARERVEQHSVNNRSVGGGGGEQSTETNCQNLVRYQSAFFTLFSFFLFLSQSICLLVFFNISFYLFLRF